MEAWLLEWLADDRLQCDGLPTHPAVRRRTNPSHLAAAGAGRRVAGTHPPPPAALPVLMGPAGDADTDEIDAPRDPWRRYGAKAPPLNADDLHGLLERITADWNEPARDRSKADIAAVLALSARPSRHQHGMAKTSRASSPERCWHCRQRRSRGNWLHDPVRHARLAAVPDAGRPLLLQSHAATSAVHRRHDGSATRHRTPVVSAEDTGSYANTASCDGKLRFNQTLEEHLIGVQANASRVTHALPDLDAQPAGPATSPRAEQTQPLTRRSAGRTKPPTSPRPCANAPRATAPSSSTWLPPVAARRWQRRASCMHWPTRPTACAAPLRSACARSPSKPAAVSSATSRWVTTNWPSWSAARPATPCSRITKRKPKPAAPRRRQALLEEDSHVLYEGDDRHAAAATAHRRSTGAPPDRRTRAGMHGRSPHPGHRKPAWRPPDRTHVAADERRPGAGRTRRFRPRRPARADPAGALGRPAGLTRAAVLGHLAARAGARPVRGLPRWPRRTGNAIVANALQKHRASPALWIDEFKQAHADCAEVSAFKQAHDAFAKARQDRLAKADVRRIAELLPVAFDTQNKAERRSRWATLLREAALRLHADPQNHVVDPHSGKRVSFGLIRMANIDPLFDTRPGAVPVGRTRRCAHPPMHLSLATSRC